MRPIKQNGTGRKLLEKAATQIVLATPEQVTELKELLSTVRLPEGTTEKWLSKANVETFDDMPGEQIAKCIQFVRGRIPALGAA
jgi:hypothetical protein